jgi:GNAT superfamily N-acetyltransferase
MDIFWVHQKARGQNAGWYLFKKVQELAKARGVQRMLVGSKLHKDASWLFERLGYEPIETYYSTWLGD